MPLKLPVQRSVDRSARIEPFTIPDFDVAGGVVVVTGLRLLYGPYPGDPAHLLRPLCLGRPRC
ncbi:hypothetical protein [Cryptosporangium minutisporangium]|uniref:Uncharacterized protein n=1 Tax=Cryptosporangium minutisporangium TaxID=113569 RepID=A0ABP6SSJ3_9ACTN